MISRIGFFATLTAIFVSGQPDLLMLVALATLGLLAVVSFGVVLLRGPEALFDTPLSELSGLRREPR